MRRTLFVIFLIFTAVSAMSTYLLYHSFVKLTFIDFIFSTGLAISITILFLLFGLYSWRHSVKNQIKVSNLETQCTDISAALNEQQTLFETFLMHTNVGIALINLDGQLFRVNNSLCEILGYTKADILSMNFYYLIHPNDLKSLQMHIQDLIDHKIQTYQSEQQCFRKNGEVIWIMTSFCLIQASEEKPVRFIIQVQNITLQKKAEERLSHMAYHDPLTGLANRNKLEQFIYHTLASARRHHQGFALLFLDLDRFKNINDTIGHDAGDLLLQIVAERLRNTVRSTDMVTRLGGDEFVLLISDVKKTESIALIAQKILEGVMRAIVIKGKELYITTSIGISFFPYDGQTMQVLMKNADLALYRAKEHGRNNYQFYTVEMTSSAQNKLALQNALGHALAKNEFCLHYQPKMEISSRHITGIEALLRWKNNDFGLISSNEIISIAEESGLIIPVSQWVLLTACKQLKKWHEMGFTSLTLAVNFSARQFKQGNFADEILQVLADVGIPPAKLEIEITESTIMQDPENTMRILYALKDLGVKIVIDDFGTGYWSLNNLRRLSIDEIKIDKTFIRQITTDETSIVITRAIIAMANNLGIKALAEGVETREQYELLVKEGCAEIQGYYLTKPLPDEKMTQFLQHPIPDAEAISAGEISS